jgi:hypothetical protein
LDKLNDSNLLYWRIQEYFKPTGAKVKINWDLPEKCADEFPPCELCGEPYCKECDMHYADCAHPGPDSIPGED